MSKKNKQIKRMMRQAPGPLKIVDLKKYKEVPEGMTRCYTNTKYNVQIYDNQKTTKGTCIKVMVKRWDNRPLTRHWRELQNIKNEIFGEDITAIEYFPPEKKLVDSFNFYWFCVFKKGEIPEIILG
jgi:hypothetical protein